MIIIWAMSVKLAVGGVIRSAGMSAEKRLLDAGYRLPAAATPGGNYVPAKTVGKLVYLAGVVSMDESGVIAGRAGDGCGVEEGYAAARACVLTQLAALRQHLGSLDAIAEVVSVTGFVNAAPGFVDMPKVINGASDLLVEVFGDAGRHVRAAVEVLIS